MQRKWAVKLFSVCVHVCKCAPVHVCMHTSFQWSLELIWHGIHSAKKVAQLPEKPVYIWAVLQPTLACRDQHTACRHSHSHIWDYNAYKEVALEVGKGEDRRLTPETQKHSFAAGMNGPSQLALLVFLYMILYLEPLVWSPLLPTMKHNLVSNTRIILCQRILAILCPVITSTIITNRWCVHVWIVNILTLRLLPSGVRSPWSTAYSVRHPSLGNLPMVEFTMRP